MQILGTDLALMLFYRLRRNSKAKDDSSDAFLLGDYLRRHLDESPI